MSRWLDLKILYIFICGMFYISLPICIGCCVSIHTYVYAYNYIYCIYNYYYCFFLFLSHFQYLQCTSVILEDFLGGINIADSRVRLCYTRIWTHYTETSGHTHVCGGQQTNNKQTNQNIQNNQSKRFYGKC